ncbi:MAG: hypothetical protein OXH15_07465 [Gammaproteobacteria bacterium]|nr:hypothetical protein [Gammaproteobacteria bacterium]
MDNPFGAVPRADAGPDQPYGSEEAAGWARASLDVVARADAAQYPHRKEHRPIHRESGRIGHDRNIALFEDGWRPMAR